MTWKINKYIILITSVIIYFIIKGIKSSKAINKTLDQGLEVIKKYTNMEEIDIGDYKKIMIKIIFPFYTTAYKIKNVGFLAILSINIGIFQVFSFHLSPYQKDFPILIIDYMQYFGIRKTLFETYNATIYEDNDILKNFINEFEQIKNNYSDIKEWKLSPQWADGRVVVNMRKEGNDKQDDRFTSLFSDVIEIYMKNVINMPKLEGNEKNKKAELIKEFAEQLVINGGIASKIFKSDMKEEDVIKLFIELFFGFNYQ